ncbi:cryptochrome/photolyase family protein [Parvularcula dongshanensis]|uniref:Deoxyribodipyrimidine photolyase-related protein n=1 Tax=Parvularcula dongshanensis TaxID=1173995 RepID=A0A840I7X2_9PROT|nr:cryptochrome/photolyase family protein [Parvularcula dongshanensis]MBB4660060.1 deoxyribodipyrimidine photolyase-related protein [Parvularcula dongshanensis]
MPALRLVLGDQLTRDIPALRGADPARDVVLMAEVWDEATYVRHHKQKIVFLFCAMRSFAESLRAEGFTVRYVTLDDPANTGSLFGEVRRAFEDESVDELVTTACGEVRLADDMEGWQRRLNRPVTIRDDDRFVCSLPEFRAWAEGRKALRMEFFYREMRKKTGLLMRDGKPEGGQWNFDQDNRKRLPDGYEPPERPLKRDDPLTREVMALVEDRFGGHFGTLDHYAFGHMRDDALLQLGRFVEESLPRFGHYQDAMATGQDFLNHSLLSVYMNAGLLTPMEVCEAAEEAYREGHAPLNCAEGFIRQIIGWREYVRGIYWLKMPEYKKRNALGAEAPLPDFYWTAETDMHCVAEAVRNTRDNAYAHHIQRLMITGQLAMLLGVHPDHINEWYLVVYADAYEWVQLPNTHGMAIFADGGVMGSKPYAASGAYINRMSDYCGHCAYDVGKKTGKGACPFNYLDWDFLMRNEGQLRQNARMKMPYRNLDRKDEGERKVIRADAERFRETLTYDWGAD